MSRFFGYFLIRQKVVIVINVIIKADYFQICLFLCDNFVRIIVLLFSYYLLYVLPMSNILSTLDLEISKYLVVSFSFLVALVITYFSIPTIIAVARKKGLYDKPNGRGSHDGNVPTLGGVAIFAGFMISVSIFIFPDIFRQFKYIVAALIMLFFIGIKDDILVIDPKKKLYVQLAAAAIMTILGDVRISSFHGFAAINELSYLISIFFSIFVLLLYSAITLFAPLGDISPEKEVPGNAGNASRPIFLPSRDMLEGVGLRDTYRFGETSVDILVGSVIYIE